MANVVVCDHRNSLFGQMILDLEVRMPGLLERSFQPGPVSFSSSGNVTGTTGTGP